MTATTTRSRANSRHDATRRRSGRTSTPTRGGHRPTGRWGWKIGLAVVAVIAVAAIVAVFASGGSDSKRAAAGEEQTRPVTISGTPLAALDDQVAADPAIGVIAPSFAGQSFDGTPVSWAPGKPTLFVFLAHWCPHCQAEVPVLTAWQAAGKAPAGLDVIGVATGTDATRPNYPPSAWLSQAGFPWPVLADNATYDAAQAMGLSGFPYFVLVDAKGAVVARASGEQTPTALDALVAEVIPR